MSGIFDEKRMQQVLEKYIPKGEVLKAGIHGIGQEINILQTFKNCICAGEDLVPSPNGEIIRINKGKVAAFDIYIGITENYLILSQCQTNKWYYKSDMLSEADSDIAVEIRNRVPLADIGTCFPLADIQDCKIKKVWMGAFNCMITLKNGSFFKIQLPKRGGLGNGMPHHAEYREAILACLNDKN